MSTKKPWRTVITGTSTGRFTREQIRDAIDSVSSKSKVGGPKSKGDGTVREKPAGGASDTGANSSARDAPKNGSAAASKNGRAAKAPKGTPD